MTLFCIGDSIVEGKASTPTFSFVEQVAARLSVGVINLASGGSTVTDVRTQLAALSPSAGDLLLVGFGVNDSRWRTSMADHEVPMADFKAQCQLLAHELTESSAGACFLLSQVPVIDERLNPYKPDKTYRVKWQAEYERIKVATLVPTGSYIDAWSRWNQRGREWMLSVMADGLHPNDEGHSLLADVVVEHIAAEV